MASLSRGISFRRQGSSGMSWTDTWSFNEEGVLVRTMKEEAQQQQQQQQQQHRFAGSALSRIHDDSLQLADADLQEEASPGPFPTCPPSSHSLLSRSKSVGTRSNPNPPIHSSPPKPSPKFIKWIKKALHKLKK